MLPLRHHLSLEPSPGARGRAFGAANATAIATTVDTYRRLFRETAGISSAEMRDRGSALVASLGERYPSVVDELEGMAAGAAQHLPDLMAINARTELLAGSGRAECSVVGRLRGTEVTLAQTWDWHPDLAPARILWTVQLPGGAWFTTATEAGILAKLGLNGHGVACALNFLTCSADGGVAGVPIHVLLRLVLERAEDAERATELLCGAGTSASSAVTIAHAAGDRADLLAVELSPGGARVLRPDEAGHLIHTNHFLAPPHRGIDLEPAAGQGSALRLAHLGALLAAGAEPHEALATHLPDEEPVCRHLDATAGVAWPDQLATLLTTWIEPAAPSFRLATGPSCTAPFAPVALPVSAVTPSARTSGSRRPSSPGPAAAPCPPRTPAAGASRTT